MRSTMVHWHVQFKKSNGCHWLETLANRACDGSRIYHWHMFMLWQLVSLQTLTYHEIEQVKNIEKSSSIFSTIVGESSI